MLLLPIYTDDAVQTVGGRDSTAVILFAEMHRCRCARAVALPSARAQ